MRYVLAFLTAGLPVWAAPVSPEALDALPFADVVILGEVHDNPDHHEKQARAVAALHPKAVVWEMIPKDMVVPDDVADAAALSAALQWEARGWPDFAMYHPIFRAAETARHYGAEVDRTAARQAVTEGAMAVMPAGARFGLDLALPPDEQAAREAEQQAAHCNAMPTDMLPGMVSAQRLRDAALAEAVLRALDEVGPPVAVITGTGHARKDWGLPAVLALAAPDLTVLSIGQMEADPGPEAPFDLWLVSPPVERGDPCAAFR